MARMRKLSAAVEFTGLTPSANVVNFGLWTAGTPDVYKGYLVRDSGDAAVNAAGEYNVSASTKITLSQDAGTVLSDAELDAMLDARTYDKISLHSGAPGDGTANVTGAAQACTFSAAEADA